MGCLEVLSPYSLAVHHIQAPNQKKKKKRDDASKRVTLILSAAPSAGPSAGKAVGYTKFLRRLSRALG